MGKWAGGWWLRACSVSVKWMQQQEGPCQERCPPPCRPSTPSLLPCSMNQPYCGEGRPQRYTGMLDCATQVFRLASALPIAVHRRCVYAAARLNKCSARRPYLPTTGPARSCRSFARRACCPCGGAGCPPGCAWAPTPASACSSLRSCASWPAWRPSSPPQLSSPVPYALPYDLLLFIIQAFDVFALQT